MLKVSQLSTRYWETFTLKDLGIDPPEGPCCWKLDQNLKLRTAYVLFPKLDRSPCSGTLEDLCLSLLTDPEHLYGNVVHPFISGLIADSTITSAHRGKKELHSYFSLTDDLVTLKLGEAAKAGAFAWDKAARYSLKPLCSLYQSLEQLSQATPAALP